MDPAAPATDPLQFPGWCRRCCALLLILIMPVWGRGAESTPPRVGHFQATFTDRSPHSGAETQHRRHHIRIDEQQRYDLGAESFELFVPESYDHERPFGVLVWISPSPSGRMPQMWEGIIEKHNLIWVGANDSGNERGVAVRFGLALDAVHNLAAQYAIDDSRIYVAGFSGGGKVASKLPIIYPEVFDGAIAMGGVAFYRPIALPDKKNQYWRPTFDRPPAKMFDRARRESRIVLLIGTEDFNYQPVRSTYETGFSEDGFEHVTLLEIQGQAHTLPDASWLEKAILTVDEPLLERAKDLMAEAGELERQGKFAEAYGLYLKVSMHGGEVFGEKADSRMAALFEQARLELVRARRAAEAGDYAEAATIALKLREAYGQALPPEAEQLLRELRSNPEAAAQIEAVEERARAQRREALAQAALETAQALVDRDIRRGYGALRSLAAEHPNTAAAATATKEADRLLSDPGTKAQIEADPAEVEARKQLVLAENYRRNRLYPQARQRLEELIKRYPDSAAAKEAKKLLEQMSQEEAGR